MTDTVTDQAATPHPSTAATTPKRRRVAPGSTATMVVAALAAAVLPAVVNGYVVSIAATAIVLAILAMSTQLLGLAGLASLGQGAYLGVGAYTAALLATDAGITNGPVQLVAAATTAAVAAAVTAPLVLRTRGTAFLMVTFAVAELVRTVASQWAALTGGDEGLHTPPITLWPGLALRGDGYIYWYLLACFLILAVLVAVVLRTRLALVLRATADHEPRLAALGHHVTRALVAGHIAAAALAGAGGALLVAAHRFLIPGDVSFDLSALALLAAAIGAGSMRGAVAGAALIIAVRDLLGAETGGHALAVLGLVFLLVAYRPVLIAGLRAWTTRRRP